MAFRSVHNNGPVCFVAFLALLGVSHTVLRLLAQAPLMARKEESLPDLVSCRDLMQQDDSYSNGDFLTQRPVHWVMRTDGSRQLELNDTCRLHRYTATEAAICLAGQHMMWIGDSITRFQFLSLVYFVHHRQWPARFRHNNNEASCHHFDEHGLPQCSESPSVAIFHDWEHTAPKDNVGWPWYHQHLGGSIDGSVFDGHMECSCARRGPECPPEITYDCAVENIFYAGSKNAHGERFLSSFVGEFGGGKEPPLKGWNFTDCAYGGKCRRSLDTIKAALRRVRSSDFDFIEPIRAALHNETGFLRKVFPPVSVVMYNRGIWGTLPKELAPSILQALSDFVGTTGRCFFKTTSANVDQSVRIDASERSYVKDAATAAGCSWFDFSHVTEQFGRMKYVHEYPHDENTRSSVENPDFERDSIYSDPYHFIPWVNEEVNNLLLNVLCNSKQP